MILGRNQIRAPKPWATKRRNKRPDGRRAVPAATEQNLTNLKQEGRQGREDNPAFLPFLALLDLPVQKTRSMRIVIQRPMDFISVH
jgi:hypothetical protein